MKKGPKKSHKKQQSKATPVPNYLPRVSVLPRELLPVFGTKSLKSSIDNGLKDFRNVQEIFPSISFLSKNNNHVLTSPLESFTLTCEPDGYYIEVDGKLRDVSGNKTIPMFVKRVHLVEPIPTMEGVYVLPTDGALPQGKECWKNTLTKIHDKYNEAYIDSLCCATVSRLVETETSPHWCKFYGSFNGRVNKYMYNVTGEIYSLKQERWFNKNKRAGIFKIKVVGDEAKQTQLVQIVEEGGVIECDELGPVNSSTPDDCSDDDDCISVTPSTDDEAPIELLEDRPVRIVKIGGSPEPCSSEESDNSDCSASSSSSSSGSDSSGSSSDSSSDSGSDSSSDSGSDGEDDGTSSTSSENAKNQSGSCEFFAEFSDFPVQVTLMERCTGTMDSLLDIEEQEEVDDKDARWSAWIYQVIAGLTVAQYYYGFVHNDLHTNNVMWSPTDDKYIYYRLDGLDNSQFYRVPTYGKLMKIIDFGRASFYLNDRKDLVISDAYAVNNDAYGQYNCPPYYERSEPTVSPNPSFDLCRLAVSMFDALYPEQPEIKTNPKKLSEEEGRIEYETVSELYNLLWFWLTDSEGKNILRNPDDTERFPDFDLYKYIARYSNNAIPRSEAQNKYFESLYKITEEEVPAGTKVWSLPLR
jgi:hypothetical protein